MINQSGLRILIVEDSIIIVKRLWNLMNDLDGISMLAHAKNGNEAIKLCQEIKPDVIFLDINIPGPNGVEVLPHLKKYSKAKIIMLTNYSDPSYRKICSDLGAEFFLDKSNEFEKINDVLRSLQVA